jgi:cell division septation protein DedD
LVTFLFASGCQDGQSFNLAEAFSPKSEGTQAATAPAASDEVIERDVEAPEVFSKTEQGLWDGRPSLGGVWVAHPDVKDPERVLIRNLDNGQFVVGALFRREREQPGPRLQLSSDAAEAIGVLAGAPVELEVVALRKEVIEPEPVAAAEVAESVEAPAEITETSLDPIAAAGAAIESAPATPAAAPVTSSLPETLLERPYLQTGIFSTETNAKKAADQLTAAGAPASVKSQQSSGKTIWRVVVGPAGTTAERDRLLTTVKAAGYTDAYPVSN